MISWTELGCAPDFDQGIKLTGMVPFVTFEQLGKELPSGKTQTDYRNIVLEILRLQGLFKNKQHVPCCFIIES